MPRFVYTFVPRAQFGEAGSFGKSTRNLEPAEGVDAATAQFAAAQLQHRVSYLIRDELRRTHRTLQSVLTELGQRSSLNRHERILRGETMMQLSDLSMWVRVFPPVAIFMTKWFEQLSSKAPRSEH